jgi:hypothetical protein
VFRVLTIRHQPSRLTKQSVLRCTGWNGVPMSVPFASTVIAAMAASTAPSTSFAIVGQMPDVMSRPSFTTPDPARVPSSMPVAASSDTAYFLPASAPSRSMARTWTK